MNKEADRSFLHSTNHLWSCRISKPNAFLSQNLTAMITYDQNLTTMITYDLNLTAMIMYGTDSTLRKTWQNVIQFGKTNDIKKLVNVCSTCMVLFYLYLTNYIMALWQYTSNNCSFYGTKITKSGEICFCVIVFWRA